MENYENHIHDEFWDILNSQRKFFSENPRIQPYYDCGILGLKWRFENLKNPKILGNHPKPKNYVSRFHQFFQFSPLDEDFNPYATFNPFLVYSR